MPTEAMEKEWLHSILDRIEAAQANLKSKTASIEQSDRHLAGLRANIADAAETLEATQARLAQAQKRRSEIDHESDRILHKARREAQETRVAASNELNAAHAGAHQHIRDTVAALRDACNSALQKLESTA
jgi:septal ring factor EnvC (AmiA/AmiB activator)